MIDRTPPRQTTPALPSTSVLPATRAIASAPVARSRAVRPPRRRAAVLLTALLAALLCLAAPATARAAEGDLTVGDTPATVFRAGDTITVTGTVDGDVFAAGRLVRVTGTVNGDVIAAAQIVEIGGTVRGSVRAAAETVAVTGQVDRAVTLAGQSVTIAAGGRVGTDATMAAERVTVAGQVDRDVTVGGGALAVDGRIGRDLVAEVSEQPAIGSAAEIGGETRIQVDADEPAPQPTAGARIAGWALGALYWIAAGLALTMLAVLLLPRAIRTIGDTLRGRLWASLGIGAFVMTGLPIALVLSAVTVIGLPVAGALLVAGIALHLLAWPVAARVIGALILRRRGPALQTLVGTPILVVVVLVPWVGMLVALVAQATGIGATVLAWWDRRRGETASGGVATGAPLAEPTASAPAPGVSATPSQ